MTHPKYIVIIGAARSGTKMLRAALATATGAGAVPYDIGYVWKVGNEHAPDDVLDPRQTNERGRQFIQRFVDGYSEGKSPAVIEKTVGNTLRVPFVASVLPGARYIHLIRDGLDVAESSRRQWTAGTDWRYLAGKLRHVPVRLAPRFGAHYVTSVASRAFHKDHRRASWGPRYQGIDADLAEQELLVVCGRQWRESVLSASTSFRQMRLAVCEIRYEDLVGDAVASVRKLTEFIDLPASQAAVETSAALITQLRVGAGRVALSSAELHTLDPEIGETLQSLGYRRPSVVGVSHG